MHALNRGSARTQGDRARTQGDRARTQGDRARTQGWSARTQQPFARLNSRLHDSTADCTHSTAVGTHSTAGCTTQHKPAACRQETRLVLESTAAQCTIIETMKVTKDRFAKSVRPLSFAETYQEGLRLFMGQGQLNQTLARLVQNLEEHHIEYMVVGAIALIAHGYRRSPRISIS